MRLIGEINRGAGDAVLQHRMPRRDQRGEICHRTAAHEQTAGGGGKSANSAKPANDSQLDRGGGRSAQPGAVENIKTGRERVRHCADEIVRARHKREEPWMIDVQVVRKNIALELREEFVRIAGGFRRILIEQRNQLRRIALRADRPVLHVGKMFGEKIDNSVTKLSHLLARQRDARVVGRRIVHGPASISSLSLVGKIDGVQD